MAYHPTDLMAEDDPPCHDCGCDVLNAREWYMVHDELWAASGLEPEGGALCIGCLEKRLGRMLVPSDFPRLPINEPARYGNFSERLLSRLGAS